MKHLKIYENDNKNYFENFIKDQDIIFKRVRDYLNTYEKGITQLQILNIIGIKYSYFYPRTCKIKFKDHRDQFDFDINLNDEQTKRMVEYVNDPEMFNNMNKFNL